MPKFIYVLEKIVYIVYMICNGHVIIIKHLNRKSQKTSSIYMPLYMLLTNTNAIWQGEHKQ